ncbi:MAG: hypothetical protein HYX37_04250 [Rhizobiales bacterium]|nr:hypothetical protein [Hyphomicrobiales bacterium]
MHKIDPIYLEHQLKRWMRPDAHRFIRPDWRRFVRPEFQADHPFALYERKYSPNQPRVPAGSREGGQWTDGEGDSGKPTPSPPAKPETIEFSAASKKGASGHHFVPKAVVKNRNVSDEAKQVFDGEKTGRLYDTRSNKWDTEHRVYSDAVGEAFDEYLRRNGTSPENMTTEQAREFVRKIFDSSDPRIKNYNMGIQMREIMQRLLRRGGRE